MRKARAATLAEALPGRIDCVEFSDRTAAALVECVARSYTHSELDILFLRLGCEGEDDNEAGETGNKLDRVGRVVATLRGRDDGGGVLELLREFLEIRLEGAIFDYRGNVVAWLSRLVESLRTDGLEIMDGRLVATTPEPASLSPQLSLLEQELAGRGLDVALAHFRQAVDSFVDSRLEASNGQLRSFLEALLVGLCEQVTGRQTQTRGAVKVLRGAGHLDSDETKLFGGLAGVSNTRGAHRGLTDREEALFRLHFTTAAARYLLARIPPP